MIGIIDYNSGNIKSVMNALEKIGQSYTVLNCAEDANQCDKLIFPGVGSANQAMEQLAGWDFTFDKPFLGVCLGMQLLCEFSEEGQTDCLKVVQNSRVRKFDEGLPVPQIGWNKVFFRGDDPLFDGISSGTYFYFVNSYYVDCSEQFQLATSDYGISYVSALRFENFWGVQFHPEKSSDEGLKLLSNFCEKC